MSSETTASLQAIQAFILKSTVPISVEPQAGNPLPVGTGSLLRINDRHFIVTARHIFQDNPAVIEHLTLADSLNSDSYTRVLRSVYHQPNNDFIDVALIEIADAEAVEAIKKNWNFLTLDNVDVSSSAPSVWLVGYPQSGFSAVGKRLVAKPVTVLTNRLNYVPSTAEHPVHQGLDIFYSYDLTAFSRLDERQIAMASPASL